MSEESVKVLPKKKGGLKSPITRFISAIISCDQNINKHFLNLRLASFKNLAITYEGGSTVSTDFLPTETAVSIYHTVHHVSTVITMKITAAYLIYM